MSNSMINPIIYCVMNNRFRQGFLQVFYFFTCRTNQHPTNIENSMAMGALAANNHNNYLRTTGPSTDRRFSNLSSIQINNTRNPSLNGNIISICIVQRTMIKTYNCCHNHLFSKITNFYYLHIEYRSLKL